MSQDNKDVVARWFREFWGNSWNHDIVQELATPDIFVQHPMHGAKNGRWAVSKFMADLRAAFPDLEFRITGQPLADRDQVALSWEGGGTHTGVAYSDFRMGSIAAASGRKMQFLGSTIFRVHDGRIAEESIQADALTAMLQLGLIRIPDAEVATPPRSTLPPGWNRLEGWPHRGV